MKKNYNLKNLAWKPNPYLKHLKKPVTVRIDQDVIEYFKALSEQEGTPYQTLMNSFLRYCAEEDLKPKTQWKKRDS